MTLFKPKDKFKEEEKQLCERQAHLIDAHVNSCKICKASFESSNNRIGIPTTPPCQNFITELKAHIEKCNICKIANQKWNFDAVPVDDDMRKVAAKLSKLFSKKKWET